MHCTPYPKKAKRQSTIQIPDARTKLELKIISEAHISRNIKNKHALPRPDMAERFVISLKTEGYANIHVEEAFYFTHLRASNHRYNPYN